MDKNGHFSRFLSTEKPEFNHHAKSQERETRCKIFLKGSEKDALSRVCLFHQKIMQKFVQLGRY